MGGWLAIVNPCAGAFRYGRFRNRWMPAVKRLAATVKYTETPGEAGELAGSAGSYDGIVVVGGDGTIFEVLTAIDANSPPLAVVPAGRGNCLALDLGLSKVSVAIAAIVSGQTISIDLLEVEMGFADGRQHRCRAASTLATGYVADVVKLAGRFAPLGGYAYAAAAAWSRPRLLPVVADYGSGRRLEGKVTGIVINNTRYLANFRAFPQASLTDGRAEVLELSARWPAQMLHNLSILTHRYFYQPGRQFSTRSARLELPAPDTLMVDGELFEQVAALTVNCRPQAVKVRCCRAGSC
jgi:diacylglycerol kinase (ATP)